MFLSIETDFNFRVKENLKVYTSLEAGLGLEWAIAYSNKKVTFSNLRLFKGVFGIKLNDKYNIAVYSSLEDKGRIGAEFGYIFK